MIFLHPLCLKSQEYHQWVRQRESHQLNWEAVHQDRQAYLSFVAALCAMAKEAKRVTVTEKDVESEKYAFRGFLLRLGFIGAESKEQRKLLLRNLSGSAAFPNQIKADSFLAAQKAKRDAAKVGEVYSIIITCSTLRQRTFPPATRLNPPGDSGPARLPGQLF